MLSSKMPRDSTVFGRRQVSHGVVTPISLCPQHRAIRIFLWVSGIVSALTYGSIATGVAIAAREPLTRDPKDAKGEKETQGELTGARTRWRHCAILYRYAIDDRFSIDVQ